MHMLVLWCFFQRRSERSESGFLHWAPSFLMVGDRPHHSLPIIVLVSNALVNLVVPSRRDLSNLHLHLIQLPPFHQLYGPFFPLSGLFQYFGASRFRDKPLLVSTFMTASLLLYPSSDHRPSSI